LIVCYVCVCVLLLLLLLNCTYNALDYKNLRGIEGYYHRGDRE
jgi:hypothetical protein